MTVVASVVLLEHIVHRFLPRRSPVPDGRNSRPASSVEASIHLQELSRVLDLYGKGATPQSDPQAANRPDMATSGRPIHSA